MRSLASLLLPYSPMHSLPQESKQRARQDALDRARAKDLRNLAAQLEILHAESQPQMGVVGEHLQVLAYIYIVLASYIYIAMRHLPH